MTLAVPTEKNSPLPYSGQDPRERRDLIIASAFTLLYFVLFAFFWFSSNAISRLTKKADASPVRTNLKIQRLAQAPAIVPPPMATQFADVSGLKETDKLDPRAALQSEHNTAASSKVVNGTDPTLGGQEGKNNDSLNMQNSQFAPNPASPPPSARLSPSATKPDPAPPLPKTEPLIPTPGPGEAIQKPAQETPPDTTPDQNQSQDSTPPSQAQAASDASDSSSAMAPPPDIFRDRSAVSGGAQMGQDASFASMGTALGRYQHKLYLGIGSRWNLKVQQTMAQIGVNRVVIRFFVNPDGSISQLDVVQGDPNSILGQISGDAINQSSNLIGPFPDALLKEMPKGFPWQLAFRIY